MNSATTGTKRAVFATSALDRFAVLRAPLIAEVVRRRHKAVVFAPATDAAAIAQLERLGAVVVVTPFAATGFNPFAGYLLKRDLTGHLRTVAPHALAYCDADAAVALHPAALKAAVPHTVAFLSDAPAETALALQQVCASLSAIVVETAETRRAVVASSWLETAVPIAVAPSAGIDVRRYTQQTLPPAGDGFVFALMAVGDDTEARDLFAAAAARIRERSNAARFIVADDRNTSTSAAASLLSAHVVVHASRRPGLSSGLLHGLAAGRPLITTDVAACRDTVDERVNGCIVPPGDVTALADAMASFLRRTDLMPAMARASRLKAERRYDVAEVNRITLDALGLGDGFAIAA